MLGKIFILFFFIFLMLFLALYILHHEKKELMKNYYEVLDRMFELNSLSTALELHVQVLEDQISRMSSKSTGEINE